MFSNGLIQCGLVLFAIVASPILSRADNYGKAVLNDLPTGYWRFNETAGSTATDGSGHGNSAFYQSDGSTYAIGQAGFLPYSGNTASHFNVASVFDPFNTNSAILSQQYAPALHPYAYANTFTIEGWVRDVSPLPANELDPNNGSRFFFASNYGFGLTELNEPHFVTFSRKDYILSSTIVSQDQWHQMAVSFTGFDATFYVDGVNVGAVNISRATPGALQTNTQFGIGRRTTGASPWLGDVDELSIFDTVLSDEQIQNHYVAALSEFGDANGDKQVSFADLVAVAQNYGQNVNSFKQGDFDGDGAVNFADLVTVAQHYGSSIGGPVAGPGAVPEPGVVPLLGVGSLLLMRWGRGRMPFA